MKKVVFFLISFFWIFIVAYASNIEGSETSLYNFIFDFNSNNADISNYYDVKNNYLNDKVNNYLGKVSFDYKLNGETEETNKVNFSINYNVDCLDKNDCLETKNDEAFVIVQKTKKGYKITNTNLFDHLNPKEMEKQNEGFKIAIIAIITIGMIGVIVVSLIITNKKIQKNKQKC